MNPWDLNKHLAPAKLHALHARFGPTVLERLPSLSGGWVWVCAAQGVKSGARFPAQTASEAISACWNAATVRSPYTGVTHSVEFQTSEV